MTFRWINDLRAIKTPQVSDYLDQVHFLTLLSSICSGDLPFHGHYTILLFLTFKLVQLILYLKITFHLIQNANLKEFTKANGKKKSCVLHIHKSMHIYFSIMPYSVKVALKRPIAHLLFMHKWSILWLITLIFDFSDEISTCSFKVLFFDICKANDFILHNTKVYILGSCII